jgi:hypothetical protein
MFDSVEIGIPCPKCGQKTQKTIAWIKANDTFACDGCAAIIRIDRDELLRGLNEIDKSVDDLKRQIRNLSKSFKL